MDTLDIKLERIIPVGNGSKAHSELEGLGYEESGHIGFASSQEVSAINERLGNVEKDYLKSEDKSALQEQIDTNAEAIRVLSDGIDPEKIDGLKEVAEYVNEHVEEVVDINKRLTAIEEQLSGNLLSEPVDVNAFDLDGFMSIYQLGEALGCEYGKSYVANYTYKGETKEVTLVAMTYAEANSGDNIEGVVVLKNPDNSDFSFYSEDGSIACYIIDKASSQNGEDLVYNENNCVVMVMQPSEDNVATLPFVINSIAEGEAVVEYASKEEVEALGERVDGLESKKIPFGEPLVVYASIAVNDRTITIEKITGATMVDWGDGSAIEDISTVTKYTHTYNATNPREATPYTIKFYGNITAIGSYAFSNLMSKIKGVDIPYTVTKIGARAFYNCYISPRITIPARVTSIGDYCFSDCHAIYIFEFLGAKPTLESGSRHFTSGTIIVPNRYLESYKTATDWAPYVDRLDSYALASELENIGGSSTPSGEPLVATYKFSTANSSVTVKKLTNATSVDWGDGSPLEDISSKTQYTHTYEKKGYFEAKFYGVTSLSSSAFSSSPRYLHAIKLPHSITNISEYAFDGCTELKSVELCRDTYFINQRAFRGCSGLKSISFYGLSSLLNEVFKGCTNLQVIEILTSTPPSLSGTNIFPTTTQIIVPYKYLNAYKTDTNWSTYASQIDAYAMASDIDNINTELTNIIEGEGV